MISNKEKTFLSAVLYVHNNETQIVPFLERLHGTLSENFEKFEIICVDDCSTDGSVATIKSFAQSIKNPAFTVVNMSVYQGIELSMNAGVDLTIGDFVFEFDSLNMDYPAATIMDIYHRSLKGYDIVSASPDSLKYLPSILFYRLFNDHSNTRNKIGVESFRILSRRAINRVHSINVSVPYRKAIRANCGLDTDVITYKRVPTKNLKNSKEFYEDRMNTAINSLILFTNVSYKISIALTLLMLVLSVVVGGYTLFVYFGQNKPVSGWTTIMLFLSIAFVGIFLVFAIVIKYLSIIIDLIFKKQKYLIRSVDKINK
jgi:polyisoprenyl-phosphate glycosyltransferase